MCIIKHKLQLQSSVSKQYTPTIVKERKNFSAKRYTFLSYQVDEMVSHTPTPSQYQMMNKLLFCLFRFIHFACERVHAFLVMAWFARTQENFDYFILFIVRFPFWTFDKFWQIYLEDVEKFAPSKRCHDALMSVKAARWIWTGDVCVYIVFHLLRDRIEKGKASNGKCSVLRKWQMNTSLWR